MSKDASDEIWVRKMRALFRKLDTYRNGYLMVDDILSVGASIFVVYPKMDSYKNRQIVNALVYLWYKVICSHVDQRTATKTSVNEARFIDNLSKAIKGEFGQKFEEIFAKPLFTAMDQDDDGCITHHEFTALMMAFNSVQSDVDIIFRMHADKQKMNVKEFLTVFKDFFTGEDPNSKINRLWGPVMQYKRAQDCGKVECGTVWKQKMETMFRRLDVNRNNYLRFNDLLQIGHLLIKKSRLDKTKANSVIRNLLRIWVRFLAIDKNGRLFLVFDIRY